MTFTDWIAAYAGVVATAALALEIRRWVESGPRLHVQLIYPGEVMPPVKPPKTYIFMTVKNRGDQATTITHMVLYDHKSRFDRLRSKRSFQAVIPSPSMSGPTFNPPYVLEPGHTWTGAGTVTPELEKRIKGGHVEVGIIASHSNRTFSRHVREKKAPKEAI